MMFLPDPGWSVDLPIEPGMVVPVSGDPREAIFLFDEWFFRGAFVRAALDGIGDAVAGALEWDWPHHSPAV